MSATEKGKVVMLAFSAQSQASMKLRAAAAEYGKTIVCRRVIIRSHEVVQKSQNFRPKSYASMNDIAGSP